VAREPVDGAAAGVERHLPGALRRACHPPHPVLYPGYASGTCSGSLGRRRDGPLRRRPACACACAEKRKKPSLRAEASFRWAASVFGCIGPQNPSHHARSSFVLLALALALALAGPKRNWFGPSSGVHPC
jgi:hypothetical protein